MRSRYEHIVDRLASIEEELRDLAYDELRSLASANDPDTADRIAKEEKRILRARRALAKAIGELSAGR